MRIPVLFPRVDFPTPSLPVLLEESHVNTSDVRQCKPSFTGSWFQWCPIDVVIWAIISTVIVIMAWKLYTTNRLRRTKGRKVSPVKKNGYYRLSYPHPMGGDYSTDEMTQPYAEKNNYGHGHEHLEFAGPTDPYHVVSTLDDSLITKDEHFKHAKMPEPVLSDKRAEKPSALGFSPERTFTASPPVSPRMETTSSFNTGQESPVNTPHFSSGQSGTFVNHHGAIAMPHPDSYVVFEATPPPVYIPNPRLDTV